MTLTEKISIIVPVYKVEKYLVRCVDSIVHQTYENLEIILVDDGSPDASGSICDSFTDPRIRVIHKENGGLSSARNAGLDIATGDYIGFIDSDDWIAPDMYETMLRMAKEEQADIVCVGNWEVDSQTGAKKLGICPEKTEVLSGEEFTGRMFLWQGCDSSVCDKLFKRSFFDTLRYPLGQLSEDVATTYKITLQAERTVLCAKPMYYYFQRPESITKLSVSEKTFHYPEHTRVIYDYIRANHPTIAPQARYLRVRAINYLALILDQAEDGFRKSHARQLRQNRRELGKHLGFFLKCPWFGKQEKITAVLLVLNLYRLLRPIFHRENV